MKCFLSKRIAKPKVSVPKPMSHNWVELYETWKGISDKNDERAQKIYSQVADKNFINSNDNGVKNEIFAPKAIEKKNEADVKKYAEDLHHVVGKKLMQFLITKENPSQSGVLLVAIDDAKKSSAKFTAAWENIVKENPKFGALIADTQAALKQNQN